MKSRAQRRRDASLLAPFEITIAYHGQLGDKAAKTRKQNAAKAEQKAAQAEQEAASDKGPAKEPGAQAELETYKAELEAKLNESVAHTVEKKLAEMQRAPGGGVAEDGSTGVGSAGGPSPSCESSASRCWSASLFGSGLSGCAA